MPYKDKQQQREYQRQWVQKRRHEFLRDKTCVGCGATSNLEVDHIDPTTKLSHRIWNWSQERREKELAKCQVLCVRCHDFKTKCDNAPPCGTDSRYHAGCKCQDCKRAHAEAWRLLQRKKITPFDSDR